ncbi:MAG TPA: phage baseplate assembly protein V, partial [Pyrinomonadaceae bacterium]
MTTEELLTRLVERVEGRYYGKYRGVVVDNADPENRGRLKVRVPAVFGGEVVTGWAMPCAPYGGGPDRGLFFVPEVDDGVWVEFEMGDVDYPVWVGTFWAKPGGTTEVPKPADAQSPPTRKIIRTLKGHSVEMEDKDGEEVFVITYNDGDKTNVISMDKDGLTVTDANENSVTMTKDGVVVTDVNDNKVTMNADGTAVVDANGNKLTMDTNGTVVEDANSNRIEM